jgi:hypothetical protein
MKYVKKFGAMVRDSDQRATAGDMQDLADDYRQTYRRSGGNERLQGIANAAYCQAMADKKRWHR